jgi:hypothetical protein
VTTSFVPWYPLAAASENAPAEPGVFQVKIPTGLLDYPGGKSAMVCYGAAENLQAAVAGLAGEHTERDFLCRHQVTEAPAVLLDFVKEQFRRRFGREPGWPVGDSN